MAAQLYPGIRSVQLLLDTPTDQTTGRVRDDLSSVKVWYSKQSNVNTALPPAFDGLSLSITIPDLDASTTYYIKYAFVSAIDTSVFSVHPELSTTVLADSPPLSELTGSITHPQYRDPLFIINIDNTNTEAELRFGRTIGGPASVTWNGQYLQTSKPLIPYELGIKNISATEPANPFASQIWLQVIP
jgi:hypothetical protein